MSPRTAAAWRQLAAGADLARTAADADRPGLTPETAVPAAGVLLANTMTAPGVAIPNDGGASRVINISVPAWLKPFLGVPVLTFTIWNEMAQPAAAPTFSDLTQEQWLNMIVNARHSPQAVLDDAIRFGAFPEGTTIDDIYAGRTGPVDTPTAAPPPAVSAPPTAPTAPTAPITAPAYDPAPEVQDAWSTVQGTLADFAAGRESPTDFGAFSTALSTLDRLGEISPDQSSEMSGAYFDGQRFAEAFTLVQRSAASLDESPTAVGDVEPIRLRMARDTIADTPAWDPSVLDARALSSRVADVVEARNILNRADRGTYVPHEDLNRALGLVRQHGDTPNLERAQRLYDQSYGGRYGAPTDQLPVAEGPTAVAGAPAPLPPNNNGDGENLRAAIKQAIQVTTLGHTVVGLARQGVSTFGAARTAERALERDPIPIEQQAEALYRGFNGDMVPDDASPAYAAHMEVGRNIRNSAIIGLGFRLGPVSGNATDTLNTMIDVRQQGGSLEQQLAAGGEALITSAIVDSTYNAVSQPGGRVPTSLRELFDPVSGLNEFSEFEDAVFTDGTRVLGPGGATPDTPNRLDQGAETPETDAGGDGSGGAPPRTPPAAAAPVPGDDGNGDNGGDAIVPEVLPPEAPIVPQAPRRPLPDAPIDVEATPVEPFDASALDLDMGDSVFGRPAAPDGPTIDVPPFNQTVDTPFDPNAPFTFVPPETVPSADDTFPGGGRPGQTPPLGAPPPELDPSQFGFDGEIQLGSPGLANSPDLFAPPLGAEQVFDPNATAPRASDDVRFRVGDSVPLFYNLTIFANPKTPGAVRDTLPILEDAVRRGDWGQARRVLGYAFGVSETRMQGVMNPTPISNEMPVVRREYLQINVPTLLNTPDLFRPVVSNGSRHYELNVTPVDLQPGQRDIFNSSSTGQYYRLNTDWQLDKVGIVHGIGPYGRLAEYNRSDGNDIVIPAGSILPQEFVDRVNQRLAEPDINARLFSSPGTAMVDGYKIDIPFDFWDAAFQRAADVEPGIPPGPGVGGIDSIAEPLLGDIRQDRTNRKVINTVELNPFAAFLPETVRNWLPGLGVNLQFQWVTGAQPQPRLAAQQAFEDASIVVRDRSGNETVVSDASRIANMRRTDEGFAFNTYDVAPARGPDGRENALVITPGGGVVAVPDSLLRALMGEPVEPGTAADVGDMLSRLEESDNPSIEAALDQAWDEAFPQIREDRALPNEARESLAELIERLGAENEGLDHLPPPEE